MNHWIATLVYCGANPKYLDYSQDLRDIALQVSWEMDFRVRESSHHSIHPQGASAVVSLHGGHVALHSFPQRQCIYVDCFTGPTDSDPKQFIECLAKDIGYKLTDCRPLKRDLPRMVDSSTARA